MGKGITKFNKSVNKKAQKTSKSKISSSRGRWNGGNEPILTNNHADEPYRNNKLRNKDGYSLRGTPMEDPFRKKNKKKKDNSYELRNGKANCSSSVQPSIKKMIKKDYEAREAQRQEKADERTDTLAGEESTDTSNNRESPWLEAHVASSNRRVEVNESRPLKRHRSVAGLPTVDLPTGALDRELMAFASYVQLTPQEQAAREALVQSLQEVAAKQQQEVRVFGSFATPQVCVFMSDIDIALWGAIPDPPTPTTIKAPPAPTPEQLEEERKRKRLESWKLALAQVDAANETVPDVVRHASVGSIQEALSSTKSADEDASSSFFTIDRVGSVAEASDSIIEKTSTAHSSAVAAPKTMSSRDSCDDSDDDSADKMESYLISSSTRSKTREANYTRYVSLSSEGSDEESILDEEDDTTTNNMHVSFFSNPPPVRVGPTGRIRNKVLDALGSFRQDIRCMNSQWIRRVTFITKARVPILKMATVLGVEVDVAVGGHNGADTSQFAAKQSELYKSFSTVVLFLKALLHQHRLDEPFKGGLGSYKLYVLVAYHIHQHLLAGGQDEPGEVLINFFFRYGDINGFNYVSQKCRTRLRQHEPLYYKEDTVADLSNVFNLDLCKDLFRRAWDMLWKIMMTTRKANKTSASLLRHLIDGPQIRAQRNLCQRQTAQVSRILLPKKRQIIDESSVSETKRPRKS